MIVYPFSALVFSRSRFGSRYFFRAAFMSSEGCAAKTWYVYALDGRMGVRSTHVTPTREPLEVVFTKTAPARIPHILFRRTLFFSQGCMTIRLTTVIVKWGLWRRLVRGLPRSLQPTIQNTLMATAA